MALLAFHENSGRGDILKAETREYQTFLDAVCNDQSECDPIQGRPKGWSGCGASLFNRPGFDTIGNNPKFLCAA